MPKATAWGAKRRRPAAKSRPRHAASKVLSQSSASVRASDMGRIIQRTMDEPEPDPVILPIEDALDLHPFAPRDVRSVVDEYLRQAAALGVRDVRLIHGKGTGTQRAIVRSVLAGLPAEERCVDGRPDAGGGGATVVVVK